MRLFLLLLILSLSVSSAAAQSDPRTYDLRFALMPLTFQPGISSSLVGSAARVEVDPAAPWTLQLQGRVPWLTAAGRDAEPALRPSLRAGLFVHVVDDVSREAEEVTVRPQDASVVSAPVMEAGHDVRTVQQRLGSPRMRYPGDDGSPGRELGVRHMQSLRLLYDYAQAVERLLPRSDDANRHALNRLHTLALGYSFGSQWHEPPGLENEGYVTGFKRYYLDVLLSAAGMGKVTALQPTDERDEARHFPIGVRLGLEGALCGLVNDWPGLGMAYTLELGVLPGQSGVEGYLFLALGLEFDVALRER